VIPSGLGRGPAQAAIAAIITALHSGQWTGRRVGRRSRAS
jgi:hypothetical protein